MDKGKAGDKKADGEGGKPRSPLENKRRLYGALGAAALLVVALILLLSGGDDDSSGEEAGAPEIVSVDSLRDAVSSHEPPVYWAGEQQETEIELSEPEAGRTYVRYLTGGAEAGDERADFLTVGTYAQENPAAALREQSKEQGGVLGTAPGGATVFFLRDEPRSVYLAYPGVEAQIEVYDPSFTRALQLVNSGQIVPAG